MLNHEEDLTRIQPVIAMTTRLTTKLQHQLVTRGVEPIDALLGTVASAHAVASRLHGDNPVAAVEWMRNVLDVIERQALAAVE
ncbi:MAG: hypothetical protein EOP89_03650 [Lysobacteraceae bacterium]|nr:MAG: hypothetical protein EOP89_03650 [Xanthomonadaceae bacterium]